MPTLAILPSTIELLKQLPLFKDLSEVDLQSLVEKCRMDRFDKEEAIFFQGDPADRIWIVRQGKVKIVRHEEDGREVILEIIQPGEVFGGGAIYLTEQPGNAMAITRAETISFSATVYDRLLRDHPEVAIKLIRMLGGRLHSLLWMNILAGERVERRLAHILLKLANRVGHMQEDGILISIPLSRQDLADMSGTTLETAIRTMSRFRGQEVVKTLRGGYVLITDPDKLATLGSP